MALRLDYADPLASRKVSVTTLPDGGVRIDVPPSRAARVPLVGQLAAAGAALAAGVVGTLLFDGPLVMQMVGVPMFMGAAAGMAFLVGSAVAPLAKRQPGIHLRAMWHAGILTLSGPAMRNGDERIEGCDVSDVRVDFAGGMEGAEPHLHITLCRRGGAPLLLLAEQDPGDLLLVTETLRRLLGLPTKPQRMAAWFRRTAAEFGSAPAAPLPVIALAVDSPIIPAPTPDVPVDKTAETTATLSPKPVLAYATPDRTSGLNRANEFKPTGMTLWFKCDATHAAFIAATVVRIQVVWHEGIAEFPCSKVYGVYVGATSELAPLTLYVCMLDGIRGVLTGVPPEMLRNAARLLNKMLGIEGGDPIK